METIVSEYEKQALGFLEKTKTKFSAKFLKYDYHFEDDTDKRNIFRITLKNDKHRFSFNFGDSINNSSKEIQKLKILGSGETTIYYGFKHSLTIRHESVYFGHSIETSYPVLLSISEGKTELETLLNTEQIQKDYNDYIDRIKAFNKVGYNYGHGKISIDNKISLDEVTARIRKRIHDTIKEAKEKTETINEGQKDSFETPTAYDVLACLTKYDPGTFENFCSEYGYDEDSRKAEKVYKGVVKEYSHISKLFTDEEMKLLAEIN